MKRIVFIFIILATTLVICLAQKTNVQTYTRTFDEKAWEDIKHNNNYKKVQKRLAFEQETKKIGYEDQVEQPKEVEDKNKPFANPDLSGLRPIGIAFLVIVGSLLLYLFIKNIDWSSDKKIDDMNSILAEIEEDLPNADVQTPLDKAIQNKQYKLATRLYYLLLIKKIADKQLIKWSKEKTNRTYITELRNYTHLEDFKKTTYLYEKAWFGKDDVTEESFNEFRPLFDELIQKV